MPQLSSLYGPVVPASGFSPSSAWEALQHLPKDHPLEYVQGLGLFAVINIVAFVLVPLIAAACICGRYCCDCCCRGMPNKCIGLRCGASYPTSPTCCGCGCGFVRLGRARPDEDNGTGKGKDKDKGKGKRDVRLPGEDDARAADLNSTRTGRIVFDGDEDSPSEWSYGYPRWSRLIAFLAMACWVALGSWIIASAHFQGNNAMTRGLMALGDDTTGVGHSALTLLDSTVAPVQEALVGLAADVVVPLVKDINGTLMTGLQLPRVRAGLTCINGTLRAPYTPDLAVAKAFLTNVRTAVGVVQGDLGGIAGALDDLVAVQNDVRAQGNTLKTRLGYLTTNFTVISSRLDTVDGALTNLTSFKTGVVASLNSVKSDLQALQSGYPSSATFSDAAGPSSGAPTTTANMYDLMGGGLQGRATETGQLVTKLTAIKTALAALPDSYVTAQALDGLDASIVAAQGPNGVLAALVTSLDGLQTAVGHLPHSSDLATPLTDIIAAGYRVFPALASVQAALISVESQLAHLPSIAPLLAELDKVRPLVDSILVTCLPHFQAVLDSVNATLLALPPAASHPMLRYTQASYLNSTVNDALSAITDVRQSLLDANASMTTSIDISTYKQQVVDANGTVATQLGQLNVTSLLSELSRLDSATGSINLTSVRSAIDQLNSSLTANRIDPSHAADMRSFGYQRGLMTGNLTTNIPEYTRLAKGYCSAGASQYGACAVDGDCTAGVCSSIATKRCFVGDSVTGGGSEQGTACTQDSDCSGTHGARCLGDSGRAGQLKAMLDGASADLPNLTPAINSVDSAITSASSNDPSSSRGPLDDARSSIAGLDVSQYTGQVDGVLSGLDGQFNIADVHTAISDANNTLSSTDWASYDTQVDDGQAMVDSFIGPDSFAMSSLRDGIAALDGVTDLLTVKMHGPLGRMSRPALAAAKDAGGLAGILRAVTSAADDLLDAVHTSLEPAHAFVTLPDLPKTGKALDDYMPYADRASFTGAYASARGHGPLHALLSVAVPDMVVQANDTRAYGVLADKAGQAYPDGRMCVTGSCIRTTMSAISTRPLSELPLALPALGMSAGSLPLPLSRENVIMLPWILPAIAVLFGLWGMCAPFCCPCRNPRWQKCPTGCMIGISLCQLPWLLLVTALAFPLFLGVADVCTSGPNVAYRYVVDSGDALCSVLPGTDGPASSCGKSISTTIALASGVPPINISVDARVDLPKATAAILGSCPAAGSAADPFWPIFSSISSQLSTLPYTAISSVLDSSMIKDMIGFQVKDGLRTPLLKAGNATGATASTFIGSLGTSALTCDHIHGLLDEVKGLLCCTLVGPVAWYVAAWYLMAWALVICAIPTGCCGRKRLPTAPWGPAYDLARGEELKYGCCGPCCGCGARHAPGSATVDSGKIKGTPGKGSAKDSRTPLGRGHDKPADSPRSSRDGPGVAMVAVAADSDGEQPSGGQAARRMSSGAGSRRSRSGRKLAGSKYAAGEGEEVHQDHEAGDTTPNPREVRSHSKSHSPTTSPKGKSRASDVAGFAVDEERVLAGPVSPRTMTAAIRRVSRAEHGASSGHVAGKFSAPGIAVDTVEKAPALQTPQRGQGQGYVSNLPGQASVQSITSLRTPSHGAQASTIVVKTPKTGPQAGVYDGRAAIDGPDLRTSLGGNGQVGRPVAPSSASGALPLSFALQAMTGQGSGGTPGRRAEVVPLPPASAPGPDAYSGTHLAAYGGLQPDADLQYKSWAAGPLSSVPRSGPPSRGQGNEGAFSGSNPGKKTGSQPYTEV